MAALATEQRLSRSIALPANNAVLLLQVFAVSIMVFPSDEVFKAIGAGGYVAALVGYFLLIVYIAAALFGQQNPFDYRYPVRISLATLWLASLASYALMNRGMLTHTQQTGADRWLLQLADVSGVILVAAEYLRSIEDVRRVLRALAWGGAFCGIVAALQFWLTLDITPYLRKLPGFSLNLVASVNASITFRGAVHRVPGTAVDPIELGVVAVMLLPLAIYLAIHDVGRSRIRRWLPVGCIALAIPTSVSRAAILAAAIALGVFIVSQPPARRLIGVTAILMSVVGIFMTAHGLIGTLKSFFLAGTSENSVAHRVNNYPYVEQLVRQAPWFGPGGGTYIPQEATGSSLHILDNQYLTSAIELGIAGMVALIFFLLWPAIAALTARRRSTDPQLRDLCAALAGSALAATVCSATFDSLSFPMFVNVQALVVGLIGASWLLVARGNGTAPRARPFGRQDDLTDTSRQRGGVGAVQLDGGN
jgi:O-antigen ligase